MPRVRHCPHKDRDAGKIRPKENKRRRDRKNSCSTKGQVGQDQRSQAAMAPIKKAKRTMSKAAKAKISAAAKARWAKIKAAKK
jgi:hypothetical protein